MQNEMQEYLINVAIRTKIENYKEFGKTKEETIRDLEKVFKISNEEASNRVEDYWEKNALEGNKGKHWSYGTIKTQLLNEKEEKIREYDLAIEVVDEAINGFSVENIAKQKGVSIDYVERILQIDSK